MIEKFVEDTARTAVMGKCGCPHGDSGRQPQLHYEQKVLHEGTDYEGECRNFADRSGVEGWSVHALDLNGGEKTKKLISLERCMLKITCIRSKFSRIILSEKQQRWHPKRT